jgi:hypothetical protein
MNKRKKEKERKKGGMSKKIKSEKKCIKIFVIHISY